MVQAVAPETTDSGRMPCALCGDEDCLRHRGVLLFGRLMATVLVTSLIVMSSAVVACPRVPWGGWR